MEFVKFPKFAEFIILFPIISAQLVTPKFLFFSLCELAIEFVEITAKIIINCLFLDALKNLIT